VALGGGTVALRESRHALLDAGILVTLDAEDEVLAARVADGHSRPLLAGRAPAQVIGPLREARRDAYAECHGVIDTGGRSPEQVAELAAALASETRVVVPLGARSYRVESGDGLRHRLPQRAREHARGARVLVTDTTVAALWGAEMRAGLGAEEAPLIEVALDAGEHAKNLASVEKIWDAALAAGVDRDACVVALGGGVVGDVAGFAASTLLRGVTLGQVPTTLLAMVDSSVGGKTAIDRAEGKNLVGAFHQPRFVLCDVAYLATLPAAERVAGFGEVVKCALLAGEAELAALELDAVALVLGDAAATARAIHMAVTVKARIVGADEREQSGQRALLNLGHTFGHALEAESRFALRHGEAVALGLIAALRVAESLALGRAELRERVVRLLVALGLPTDLDARLGAGTFAWLAQDKKRAAGQVRFVVPVAPGVTQLVPLAQDELARLCRPPT
jgi:shikimate kinase/3-dehydroquinate synthase